MSVSGEAGLLGLQDHECRQSLAVLLVLHADHRGLGHLGMCRQRLLHFDRVDVLAAGDNHLVVASDHEQPSGFIEVADVARRHEPGVEVLPFAGGALRVALELGVVADVDAADLAGGHLVEFGVQDPDFGSDCGPARRVGGRPQVLRGRGGDHACLGGVVVVVDHVAELVHERDDDVGSHSRAGCRGKA